MISLNYRVASLGYILTIFCSLLVGAAVLIQYYLGASFFIEPLVIIALIVLTLTTAGNRILQNEVYVLVSGAITGALGVLIMAWTFVGSALAFAGLITFIGAMMEWGIPETPLKFDPRVKWTFVEKEGDQWFGRVQAMTTYKKLRVLFIILWDVGIDLPAQAFKESLENLKQEKQSDGNISEIDFWGHAAKMAAGTSKEGWHLRQYLVSCDIKNFSLFIMVTGEPTTEKYINDLVRLVRCH